MKELFAIAAALLTIAGNVPYVIAIIRGTVRPHAYTWFVWAVVSAIIFSGQLAKGAGVGALSTGVSEVFTIFIFALSLIYGFKRATKVDLIFLLAALVGMIPWLLTKDPTLSVVTAVSIDVIAFMPTLRKAWVEPSTENSMLYGSNVLKHILALCSLQSYNIATTLHSVAMVTANTLMTLILLMHKTQKRRIL